MKNAKQTHFKSHIRNKAFADTIEITFKHEKIGAKTKRNDNINDKCCHWQLTEERYLQFFELLKLGEKASWQLTDTIFVGFQFNQMN